MKDTNVFYIAILVFNYIIYFKNVTSLICEI